MKLLVAILAIAVSSCRSRAKPTAHDASPAISMPVAPVPDSSEKDDILAELRRSEEEAMARASERSCERPTAIYNGSIDVSSSAYVHRVKQGDDAVEAPIEGLDNVFSTSKQLRFTLDYPFERPFTGVVTAPITLRRTIAAIRSGFQHMYLGSTQRDIPGMEKMLNKEVTGPYGRSFHVIGDLVIEQIDLCADGTLMLFIGS